MKTLAFRFESRGPAVDAGLPGVRPRRPHRVHTWRRLLALLLPSCQVALHVRRTRRLRPSRHRSSSTASVRILGDASRPTFTGPGGAPVIHVQGSRHRGRDRGHHRDRRSPGIVVDPGSSLRLHVVTVRNNTSSEGAGIRTSGAVTGDALRIVDNTATQSGGGILIEAGGSLSCRRCEFLGNHAALEGAGVFCSGGGAVELTNSRIANNTRSCSGRGVEASECTSLTIGGSTVSGNQSGDGAGDHRSCHQHVAEQRDRDRQPARRRDRRFPERRPALDHRSAHARGLELGDRRQRPRDCGILLDLSPTFFTASHDFVASRGNCDGLALGAAMQTGHRRGAASRTRCPPPRRTVVFAPLRGLPDRRCGQRLRIPRRGGDRAPQADGSISARRAARVRTT